MYAELGRSLLESGSPLVRGESAHFLPLLYPLLTAPAWLWDDVEQAYRDDPGRQRRRRCRWRRFRPSCSPAGSASATGSRSRPPRSPLLLPELLYSSSVLAETLAYPLALAAAAAAVAALERPTARLQLAVLGFAGLATLTRLQLAVLPLCYLVAVVVGRAPRPAAARDRPGARPRGRRDRARPRGRARCGPGRDGRDLRRRHRVLGRAARRREGVRRERARARLRGRLGDRPGCG